MKFCLLILALFILTSQVSAQYRIIETSNDSLVSGGPGGLEVKLSFTKYKLDNGVTVIINEDHSDQVASVNYMFKVGSAASPSDRTGIVNFIYELLYGESQNEKISLIQNSSLIDKDYISHTQTLPSNLLNEALWQEASKISTFSKTVTQEQFELKKEKILQKTQNILYNNHLEAGQNAGLRTLFQYGNPYSWPTYGKIEHYESFQYFDLVKFYNEWFGANNLIIVISGDVQEKSVINEVSKYFGGLNTVKNGSEQIEQQFSALSFGQFEMQKESRNLTFTYDYNGTVEPMLYMAYLAPHKFEPSSYVMELIVEFLSDPNKGLITQVLKSANLSDEVTVAYKPYKYTGIFDISVKAKQGVELSVIKDTIEYILNQSFAQASLEERKAAKPKVKEVKEKYKEDGSIDVEVEPENAKLLIFEKSVAFASIAGLKLYIGMESTEKKVKKLAEYELYFNKADNFTNEFNGTRMIQPEMVKIIGNQYFNMSTPSIISILPEGYTTLKAAKDNIKIVNLQTAIVNATQEDLKAFSINAFLANQPKPTKSTVFQYPQYNTRAFENGIKFTLLLNKETSYLDLLFCYDLEKYGELVDAPYLSDIILSMFDLKIKSFHNGDFIKQLNLMGVKINTSIENHQLKIHFVFLNDNLTMIKMLLKEFFSEPAPVSFNIEEYIDGISNSKTRFVKLDDLFGSVIYSKLYQSLSISPSDNVSSEREKLAIYVLLVMQNFMGMLSPESLSIVLTGNPHEGEIVDFRESLRQWIKTPPPNIVPISAQFKDSILIQKSTLFLTQKNLKEPEVVINYLNIRTDHVADWNNAKFVKFLLTGSEKGLLNVALANNESVIDYKINQIQTGPYISYFIQLKMKEEGLVTTLQTVTGVLKDISSLSYNKKELKSLKNLFASSNLMGYEYYFDKSELICKLIKDNIQSDFYQKQAKQLKKTKKSTISFFAKDKISPNGFTTIISGNYESLSGPLKQYGFDNLILINKNGKVIKQ